MGKKSKGKNRGWKAVPPARPAAAPETAPAEGSRQRTGNPSAVPSLLDVMEEGNEYVSIVSKVPEAGNVDEDLRRAVEDLERVRGRRCLLYAANMITGGGPETAISRRDHLPFNELISKFDPSVGALDIFLITPGGDAHQVWQFVNALRPRFPDVQFLLPYQAMSAGTLWALSGNKIWMTDRAYLGPVDPQVQTRDGTRWVPAQSLLALMKWIQEQGEQALSKSQKIPWTLGPLINSIDKKELGDAVTATAYSRDMAADFLERFKFSDWTVHRRKGGPVTAADKKERATKVATLLASNERWKAHGHTIDRDTAWRELEIEIDHPDPPLGRAMNRLWALLHWVFDRGMILKIIYATHGWYARLAPQAAAQPPSRTP